MKLFRYIIAPVAITLLAINAQARTVEIKMSQCAKPLVDNINKVATKLSYNDLLILNFDKDGMYNIDGTVWIKSNIVIKGVSSKSTRIILQEGFANGKSKFTDDCFFRIKGDEKNQLKAEIKDISFELASHKGILWEKAPKRIIKIWYGDGIVIDNITSKSRDAAITNIDLRECNNVIVSNSEIENYNNCSESGCLWSKGSQKNITIRNNVFRKYGHDEVLAMWGGRSNTQSVTEMKDILIEGNDFYYGNKIRSKNKFWSTVFICFYHFKEDIYHFNNPCEVDNLVFKNNTITIDDVIGRDIAIFFDDLAKVGKIELSNNRITNTSKTSCGSNYMNDITLQASGDLNNPIEIKDNIVTNHGEILCDGKKSGYTFLSLNDIDANIVGNVVNSDYDMGLIWVHDGDINIDLRNNMFSGINKTATLNSKKKNSRINIVAFNNTFSGDTRISCQNVNNLFLDFKNNTFNSSDYHFFLQEAADNTSITFEGNTINATTGKGVMFANYSKKPYYFKEIQVTNNTFIGLSRNVIEDSFKSVKNKKIKGNIYR